MQRIVLSLAVIVAALGLVACGGGSSSSTSSTVNAAEVAEGVALYKSWERLQNLKSKGVHRMAMAIEYGTPQEVESLEEAEDEITAEQKPLTEEMEAQPRSVQLAVAKQVEAESKK
jgi:ABC-type glycerol-3-phosphate transport system substrate-binding protein